MRSWIRIVLGILLIAVLGGLFWQATRQREPVYKGRRLSVWMKDWRNGYDPALQSATREAVRAMICSLKGQSDRAIPAGKVD